MTPRSHFITSQGYEIHVRVWGEDEAPPLILWHGLLRTGQDFDSLARALSGKWRIFCPDTLGRGLSSWSKNPEKDYHLDCYAAIAQDLVQHFAIKRFAFLGTSMGGLIGMVLASGAMKDAITRLVINDIGPEVPKDAIARIRSYGAQLPSFETVSAAQDFFREVYASFGHLEDSEWQALTQASLRRRDDGHWTVHYDPRLFATFKEDSEDFHLWENYDEITAPTLVVRGESSDLLSPDLAQAMQTRGPRARLHEVPGTGHAPALNRPKEIALIRAFLTESQAG